VDWGWKGDIRETEEEYKRYVRVWRLINLIRHSLTVSTEAGQNNGSTKEIEFAIRPTSGTMKLEDLCNYIFNDGN